MGRITTLLGLLGVILFFVDVWVRIRILAMIGMVMITITSVVAIYRAFDTGSEGKEPSSDPSLLELIKEAIQDVRRYFINERGK